MDPTPPEDGAVDPRDGADDPRLLLRYAALSDVGRVRKDNQDSGFASEHLLVIADGVGGAARGDIASSTAVQALRRLDDDYVSTRHARIAGSGDQWFVEDLGSTNGTYIGSHRLTQPTTIQLGSKVRIGKTTLELRK